MSKQQGESDVWQAALSYVVKTPRVLFVLISARLSGELWLYIYLTYFKKGTKNIKYIDGHLAKTAIGLIWMSVVFIPVYYFFYGFHQIREESALDSAMTVVVYAIFLQLVVTMVTIKWKAPL